MSKSMLELLKGFKPIVKVPNLDDKAIIDSLIFQLHYRATTYILFVFCVFVTAYTIFGEAIECMGDKLREETKIEVISHFCYLGYMYTIPQNQNNDEQFSGLGQGEMKKYYPYYRWVPLMLFLQGVLFYLPHWIWKNWERKKLTHLTKDLRGLKVEVSDEDKEKLRSLAKYVAESFHTHNVFAWVYYFCEFLNFINVIANVYLIDVFLDGAFLNYGLNVLNITDMPEENKTDPMIDIFPRVTKCDFRLFGYSGQIENRDFMCILPLNNLNEKIYLFLWFWLFLLACVSILPIVYNFAVLVSSEIRKRELKKHYVFYGNYRINILARKTEIGDFFVWDLIGRNVSSKFYAEFINQLYKFLVGDEASIPIKNWRFTEYESKMKFECPDSAYTIYYSKKIDV